MPVFKCKICGGNIELSADRLVGVCQFCGTSMTLPKSSDDQRMAAFNRGNHFRRIGEFDKALSVYERLVEEDDTDAEAHWSCVLCRFGIEYVEDPETYEYVPTCHRASFDSILEDVDYKTALEYSDGITRRQYMKDAAKIAEVQKGILATSQNEEPFDVFISYKETDDNGNRTVDATLAQDIYYRLTEKGYRVFFSRITLEGKPGTEYEPYIFAALNSSRVMVLVGTSAANINAVWVKNEWSRFMAMRKKDRNKLLIPCYRDMDPYDLPEQISVLKAYDMSQIGFIQDLIHGIEKVIDDGKPKETTVKETVVVQQTGSGTTAGAQVLRGNMALEDQDWDKADAFFEEALNLDPMCAEAYLGKLLAREKQSTWENYCRQQQVRYISATTERLEACPEDTRHVAQSVKQYSLSDYLEEATIRALYKFDRGYDSALSCRRNQKTRQERELKENRLLTRVRQYAGGDLKQQVDDGISEISGVLDERISEAQSEDNASIARIKSAYEAHLAEADKIAAGKYEAACTKRENQYQAAVSAMQSAEAIPAYESAIQLLEAMNGYKDTSALADQCRSEIARLHEEARLAAEAKAAAARIEAEKQAKKQKKNTIIVLSIAAVCIAILLVVTKVIIPNNKYNNAVSLMNAGDYVAAYEELGALRDYKDSREIQVSIKEKCEKTLLTSAQTGSEILYGTYEQDGNTANGQEDIEWIVLEKEDDRILVVSKYALDCRPYNTVDTDVTWETCTLRKWLNRTFLEAAFSDAERACIPTVTVTADKNPKYSTNPGNSTQDQVFLLSINEAEKYFRADNAGMCAATEYSVAQGVSPSDNYKIDGKTTCWWWLRSPGGGSNSAAYVSSGGSVYCLGRIVYNDGVAVRPALWIDLESL